MAVDVLAPRVARLSAAMVISHVDQTGRCRPPENISII